MDLIANLLTWVELTVVILTALIASWLIAQFM